MRRRKNHETLLLALVALVGFGLLLYPTVSDWWNSYHQTEAISGYVEVVDNLEEQKARDMLREADEYNERLSKRGTLWALSEEEKAEYDSVLAVTESGMMGYLDIPKIGVTLPIYHGTSESTMQMAIGHLEGTSLPVGGVGTHCCVSSHRGLPSARLFTDLDKLEVGDTWTITVLGRTITYEYDQTRIVLPEQLEDLAIDSDQDLCTLITCTPYGVNTHRLLVRGHRVDNAPDEVAVLAEAVLLEPRYLALLLAVPMLIVLFAWALVDTELRSRRAREIREMTEELERRIAERDELSRAGGEAQGMLHDGEGASVQHGNVEGEAPNGPITGENAPDAPHGGEGVE